MNEQDGYTVDAKYLWPSITLWHDYVKASKNIQMDVEMSSIRAYKAHKQEGMKSIFVTLGGFIAFH